MGDNSGNILFDFAAIDALRAKLDQEVMGMQDTLATVLGATNQVGEGWVGNAHDQFADAIHQWRNHGQQLTDALVTLRNLMAECAQSFKTHDQEFANVWEHMLR